METIRKSSIEMEAEEFLKIGHQLFDDISNFIDTIEQKLVTPNESPGHLQDLLENLPLPENGTPATELLFNHSLRNGHPKFLGYITSSASPIGALADLLAASLNPNVRAHILSPIATETEKQIEAACTLVKNPQHSIETYSSHPEYYNSSKSKNEETQNFYEYGFQNPRFFRAIKVWLTLQKVGSSGYEKLISKLKKNGFSVLLKEREVNPKSKFLQQVISTVLSNIDNANFGPTFLAKEMHLSESQIYRKLKSITDKSTAIFIRSVRLQRAKEMLQISNKTVSEIAYEVGFNDPSYFSRVFKDEFGCTPSEV